MTYFSRYKWWSIALIILFAANIVTLLFFWIVKAGPITPPPRVVESKDERRGVKGFLVKELNFSQQQEEKYNQLFKEHQKQVRAIRDSIRASKDAFFDLLDQEVSPDQLNQLAARSAAFQQQLDIATFNHFKQVKSLCNVEQQKNFDKIIKVAVRHMGPPPPPRPKAVRDRMPHPGEPPPPGPVSNEEEQLPPPPPVNPRHPN